VGKKGKYMHPMHYKFRDEFPEKWLGCGIMISKGFTSEKKRIKENERKNK